MTTPSKKTKLAALNEAKLEEHPWSSQGQNWNVPRLQEDYISLVSEKIERRVTKKLSREFSKSEICILGTSSSLDDFLINLIFQGHSGTAPKTSRNSFGTNRGTNEDDSQSDLHPEASIFSSQTTQKAGLEVGHDMVTGVHEEVT